MHPAMSCLSMQCWVSCIPLWLNSLAILVPPLIHYNTALPLPYLGSQNGVQYNSRTDHHKAVRPTAPEAVGVMEGASEGFVPLV